ncbi:hypothetical protein ACFB49_07110 [Sphingomonas sp. DBB INV C78]|uniref:hypothetical protein n=1 Tax=Sphingomonas sp. DBB INV C78 TaxID=3349434 RepID=UPI0036D35721
MEIPWDAKAILADAQYVLHHGPLRLLIEQWRAMDCEERKLTVIAVSEEIPMNQRRSVTTLAGPELEWLSRQLEI